MSNFIKLETFLLSHDWTLDSQNSKFNFFVPPQNLGFQDSYQFHVLKNVGSEWYFPTLEKYAEILGQIYSSNQNDILNIIENDFSIFSLRIQDEEARLGNLDFGYFNALSGTLKNTLESTAHFAIRKNRQGSDNIAQKAQYYINNCRMLQTERGSFITKIGLPSDLVLMQANLFSPDNIIAEEVNETFISVIDAINSKFFSGNKPTLKQVAEDDFLRDIIIGDHGFQIIKNIRSIYEKSIGKSLDYKVLKKSSLSEEVVSTSEIKKDDVTYCKEIIKKIEDEMKTETKEFTGYVHVAKTRNAKEDRNHIELIETEFGDNVRISLKLNSDLFAIAHQAQGDHKKVKVTAEIKEIGKTYSTDYTKISKFDILN